MVSLSPRGSHQPTFNRRDVLRLGLFAAADALLPAVAEAQGRGRAQVKKLLWITPDGGESQLDTWDPRPDAVDAIRGPFQTIQTAQPGVRLSEVYPGMASRLDKITLLRARDTGTNDHLTGMQSMLGRTAESHLAKRHADRLRLPGMYQETPGVISGFNYRHDAFNLPSQLMELRWHDGRKRFEFPAGLANDDADLERRRRLLPSVDRVNIPGTETYEGHRELAFRLAGIFREGLPLNQRDIERYGGNNPIAIGMLTMREALRRGMCGAGVFRAGDWDDHWSLAQNLRPRAQQMDRALSALVDDVHRRELGPMTIVYAAEIGRFPRMNGTGREHHNITTGFLMGEEFQPGVYGESSPDGMHTRSGTVTNRDLVHIVEEGLKTGTDRRDFTVRSRFRDLFV
jgi:hypothetical protein